MPEGRDSIRFRIRALLLLQGWDATLAISKGGALMRRESSFSPEQYIPPRTWPGAPK